MRDNTKYLKDFVPYEQALELKKLGFGEPCFGAFISKDLTLFTFPNDHRGYVYKKNRIFGAPTYSQAFRWFREKYNVDAWVQPFVSEKQNGKPFLPDESYAYYIFEDGVYVADGVNFLDSEEAERECLKKLIEIVKKQL